MLGEMLSKRNITIIYFCTVSIFIMNSYLNKWRYSFLITQQELVILLSETMEKSRYSKKRAVFKLCSCARSGVV